jgi:DNA-binding CsgD family transcriptional regulator
LYVQSLKGAAIAPNVKDIPDNPVSIFEYLQKCRTDVTGMNTRSACGTEHLPLLFGRKGAMKGAPQELDPEEAMTKSKNSWRGGTDLPGQPDPASGQGAELLRALQSENQRLRKLVVYLSVTVLRNRAPDLVAGHHDVGGIDARQLKRALDIMSKQFPGHESLTSRERTVLAQIVNGASSKEAARILAVSPRTIEFHRANILLKLGARNTAELVRIVVGE